MRELTSSERDIIDLLDRAGDLHDEIGYGHPLDESDFDFLIRQANNLILARPAYEARRRGR